MYAILIIIVTITIGGHQHKFSYKSKTTYPQMVCDERAEKLSARISRRIANQIKPTKADVKTECEFSATRPI